MQSNRQIIGAAMARNSLADLKSGSLALIKMNLILAAGGNLSLIVDYQ